ncbi:MAG: outer membrane protein transport protein [Oligoflexia bacterium]|nr:outer membrane protein transport protein [Oligoflexia bacterium]
MLSLFVFLLSISTSHAQLAPLFGLGPKSSALGGTSIVVGDSSAFQVYAAPAALGFIRNVEVHIGAQYFEPKLKPFGTVVLNSNGTLGEFKTAGVLPGGGNLLAIAIPIGKKRPITFGGGFYLPFSTLIRVSGSPVNYPFYPLYSDISRNFFFIIGMGYEAWDGIAFGLNFRSTTKSTAVYALRADNSVNYSATAVEAKSKNRISISALYDNVRRGGDFPYSVGFMYRAQAGLETRISADVTAFVPIRGDLDSFPSYSPSEWALMSSVAFGKLKTSLDFSWMKWSQYVSPYGTGNINTYVIGSSRKEAQFKDVPVFRLGNEYEVSVGGGALRKLFARTGYFYYPSPVPDQTSDSNFVDNDRHGVSAGLGLHWKSPWESEDDLVTDFFVQNVWLKSKQVTKVSATTVGAPGYTSGGRLMLFGAGVKLKF